MPLDADRLIERIYDTVDDVGAWSDVLSVICEWIGGQTAIINGVPKVPGPVSIACLHRIDPELIRRFDYRHVQESPWTQFMATWPVGVPVASDAYAPFDRLKRSDFYGEILEPQGQAHGALYRVEDTPIFHVAMSICRSTERGPFTPAELAISAPLLPHLRRALQLRLLLERNQQQRRLALEALDRLTSGVLLVDGTGRVVCANRAALELAATRDAIVLEDHSVRTPHRTQTRLLQSLIGSAVRGGPGGALAVSRASGALPIAVLVAPLKGALALAAVTDGLEGAAAIFLTDPERQAEPSAERLIALYGFTPTEARVALQLAKAGTIAAAAAALRLTPETVRTHLKRIYAKTGVHRQSALVRLLASAAALRHQDSA